MKDTKQAQTDKAFREAENELIKRISEIEKEFNCKLIYLSLRKLDSKKPNISEYKSWVEYEIE